MKNEKSPLRVVWTLAAISLFFAGLFVAITNFSNQDEVGNTSSSKLETERPPASLREIREERRARAERLMEYTDEVKGEKVRLVLDRAVLRGEQGEDFVVPLNPPATPTTLKERLAALTAPNGVSPLAYLDGTDNNEYGLRLVTKLIRAEIPRDTAMRIAREYGLKNLRFPEYAPGWVIFEANDSMDALEKIDGIRGENNVASADVLLGSRLEKLNSPPNDPLFNRQWHLSRSGTAESGTDMNILTAWKIGLTGGVLGKGVTIGIIDDGIQTTHPDLAPNYNSALHFDYASRDNNPNPQGDDNHGTAVGGVAGARGNNGLGVSGSAPQATLVGLRLIADGFTDESQSADAFNHRSDAIDIKNNSWGYLAPFHKLGPLEKLALKNSSDSGRDGKGTVFTFAAGNSAEAQDSANYSELTSSIYTLTVGAIDSQKRRSSYSEPGANVVIAAPSNGARPALGITTTDRTGVNGYNTAAGTAGDYTNGFGGTSSACPALSGVIALMLEANPELNWRDVHEILMRTAVKFNPNETGWKTNAAGFNFNNNYGAGLVDATAAVNLSRTWTSLGQHDSVVATRNGLNATIPNNSAAGRTVLFSLPTSQFVVEHVTLKVDITHSSRGELEIFLTSPSGTTSQLAVVRNESGANIENYTFSTVHNWGERSTGVWTMKVADRGNGNTTGGVIRNAEMVIFGVDSPPQNPPPVVQITSPSSDSVFSPGVGYPIDVTAVDFDVDGMPDGIAKVELFENDVSVGEDLVAPYTFNRNPANNTYTYVARATDTEGLVGTSQPVVVSVRNQTPVIKDAIVSPSGVVFDDLSLAVTSVDASDPENDSITLAYRWEFSTDQRTYQTTSNTTATLPPAAGNSGKLWRCAITASDQTSTSQPFHTTPVNLVDRPVDSVEPGQSFTYQSGLVLEGDDLDITRQAIIHEFSQGPSGGTAEWIEILTLQAGSLTGWTISDESGNSIAFKSGGIWDNIPAGTIIVIYNGNTTKDPLVPADDFTSADGKMIIAHNNATYFETGSLWTTLSNSGDSISLKDDEAEVVHDLCYGNSVAAALNVGSITSGMASYFSGNTDAGANSAGEWNTTTASIGRASAFAFDTFTLVPGIVLTNGKYTQTFNDEPGANGTEFPEGWSAFSVNLQTTQTTEVNELRIFQGIGDVDGAFNFGSRIGLYAATTAFDASFIGLGIDSTSGATGLRISYDVTKVLDQTRVMDAVLQYTVGIPSNTNTQWTTIAGTAYRSDIAATGTPVKYTNIPLPLIFQDREDPIYLRWYYQTSQTNGGSGGRDAIAFDNVIISSDQSPNIVMSLATNPATFSETAGANASTATVTLSEVLDDPLVVNITSSDTSEATVPSVVIIPANQLSATFSISAVDDFLSDGPQTVSITVSADALVSVSSVVTVTDNEPSLVGVTPGFSNTVLNGIYINRLRTGQITDPPLYRLAQGSVLPLGLSLNQLTGLISGVINPSVPNGAYPITIELTNTLGGFASQTIVINVGAVSFSDYASWIDLFMVTDEGINDDPDLDDIPNLVEYAIGSVPNVQENPSPIAFEDTDTEISLTYKKAKGRSDVTLVAEWSETMEDGSWVETDIVLTKIGDDAESETFKATLPIAPPGDKKFIRLKSNLVTPP
jgi:subtilisin family serine protease